MMASSGNSPGRRWDTLFPASSSFFKTSGCSPPGLGSISATASASVAHPGTHPTSPSNPAPASTSVVQEATFDGVVVLAYRIRRVPLSPNPDPPLTWADPPTPADAQPSASPAANPTFNDPRAFPLPDGHAFGLEAGPTVHDGVTDGDRVNILAIQTRLGSLDPAITINGVVGTRDGCSDTRLPASTWPDCRRPCGSHHLGSPVDIMSNFLQGFSHSQQRPPP